MSRAERKSLWQNLAIHMRLKCCDRFSHLYAKSLHMFAHIVFITISCHFCNITKSQSRTFKTTLCHFRIQTKRPLTRGASMGELISCLSILEYPFEVRARVLMLLFYRWFYIDKIYRQHFYFVQMLTMYCRNIFIQIR